MCRKLIDLVSVVLLLSLVGSASAALPEGWSSKDINTTGGRASEINGRWTIRGDGADIWGSSDAFHFAYMPLSGDGQIIARVVNRGSGSNGWSKGGVMIRETLEPGSKHAMMVVTGGEGNGKAFQCRPFTGSSSFSSHGGTRVSPPIWIKLTREGNLFTGYFSRDGVTWEHQPDGTGGDMTPVPVEIHMARNVYIGLCVTSHAGGELRTYAFDNVGTTEQPKVPAKAQYGGGRGEPNEPYLIYTAEQLNEIGLHKDDWDKHFKLMADIDLSGFSYDAALIAPGTWETTIIGRLDGTPFSGVFDGNGHEISHLTITGGACLGLFGRLASGAEVKNLRLVDVNIKGLGVWVGGLAGGNGTWDASGGIVTNCSSTGTVSGNDFVGGLLGYNWYEGYVADCYSSSEVTGTTEGRAGAIAVGGLVGCNYYGGTISNCYSTGSVRGGSCVGGLMGNNRGTITECYTTSSVSGRAIVGGLVGINNRTITNCYSTGSVSGTGQKAGGLVGENGGTLSNCYSTGSVSGNENVGGFVGHNLGTIFTCYSLGMVFGTTDVGGLVGKGGGAYNSYWDTQTSGQTTSAGGIGRTTAQMQMADTFLGWGGCGNEGIWMIDEGKDYPRLWWENKPGEPLSERLSDFVKGSGEPNDPYLIFTAEQLNMIGLFWCDWDKHFKLMADIDLSRYTGTAFNIVGYSEKSLGAWSLAAEPGAFCGVFDGNGHTISNLSYAYQSNARRRGYVGLFGFVDHQDAVIKNVRLAGANIDGGLGDGVGTLVGKLESGAVTNCQVEATTVSGQHLVGGLVGCSRGTITGCTVDANVSGESNVGGLCGDSDGPISRCHAEGVVSGDSGVGGLVGSKWGKVTECSFTGQVTGKNCIGGLVGVNYKGSITNSYSTSMVSGGNGVGGLVGSNNYYSDITQCYSAGAVSGEDNIGGHW